MSKFVRSIKNVTNGYTSAQVKVRNATSNDAWGPSTSDMQDIAKLTYESHELFEVMDMLDKRMNDKGKNWRHVLKALTVLDFIVHVGSENVVLWAKDNLYIIKTLREFQYIDDTGRDQGASIRAKAKDLTELIQDDDRLREERLNRSSRRRRRRDSRPDARQSSPPFDYNQNRSNNSIGNRARRAGETDSDFERALQESRQTAEEDERRRKAQEVTDDDLRKAILLSEEEERNRNSSNQDLFGNQQQNSLIDTDFSAQPQQPLYTGYQQQPQQQPQQQVQYDMFGNPIYQQSVSTGVLQNAYANTGGFPQYPGYQQQQQQQPQQQFYQQTGYEQQQPQQVQPQYTGYDGFQQQQQPEPLQPLKTGSNNPFARLNGPSSSASNSYASQINSTPSMNQQQQLLQQQQTAKPSLQRRASRNFDEGHMNELNTLLANGEGIDTFGNVGDLRIPAQHTKGNFVNSSGIELGRDRTGTQSSSNPFVGTQYTGIATTTQIQPAYTGYGFGNAPQSQQVYQQQQQRSGNNLIDF